MSWPPPNYDPDYGTGYRLTLDDFRQLVSDPDYRPAIAPLLKAWFGCEITGQDGDAVDILALHNAIQSDPKMQYWLYQRAMELWR